MWEIANSKKCKVSKIFDDLNFCGIRFNMLTGLTLKFGYHERFLLFISTLFFHFSSLLIQTYIFTQQEIDQEKSNKRKF